MDFNTVALMGSSAVALLTAIGIGGFVITRRRVVPTNMTHIVQRAKGTTLYGQGQNAGNVYYQWPKSFPIIGLDVSVFQGSIFDISLKEYEAYDEGRLPFVVDIKAFFRVEDADMAAKRVSTFGELQGQLTDVLRGAVRRTLGTNKLELIMQDRSKLGNDFTTEVNSQLKEWGVTTVKTIEFMDIRDSGNSHVIKNIMEKEKSRIEKESRMVVAENLRLAEEKEIETQRSVATTRIQAEQQISTRKAEKDQIVGIATEKSVQEVQVEAKITAERKMDVQKVQDVRAAEITRDVAVVKAEQDQKVQVVKADADRETTIRIAAGKLDATLKDAEGVAALGQAKAEAEKAMLMAPVNAQITLATEIGENEGYQSYLVQVEQIKAAQAVGTEMAQAMSKADLKIIANSGDVQGGIGKLSDILTPAGGTSIAGMLTALSQTEEGKALATAAVSALGKNSAQ